MFDVSLESVMGKVKVKPLCLVKIFKALYLSSLRIYLFSLHEIVFYFFA